MTDDAVAFIRDVTLYEPLERQLEARHRVRLRFAGSVDSALALLSERPTATLMVDSRPGYADQATCELVDRLLDGALPRVNVVTVGGELYPRPAAAAFSLLASVHLPVDEASIHWDQIGDQLDALLQEFPAAPIPPRKQVEAGGIGLITYCQEFFPTIEDLLRVAHRDVTILLIGETGTGKTTLARFIHNRSPRRDRGFQHLACGGLPGDLIESELFGHTRGAFTGAERNKIGRFQAAGRGTLLLDEIDVLDLKQQVKLLRVIETGEYELVGSTETRQSEARLIVASNVELEELTARAEFRSDLYYRLNTLEFRLPALRERSLDIIPLAMQFIDESCAEHGIVIEAVSREFLSRLKRYHWPGNLRELRNHIRRAVLFAESRELTVRDLSPRLLEAVSDSEPSARQRIDGASIAEQVARSEREILEHALEANGQNRTRTARALGLSRVGLYKKLKRLGLLPAAKADC
uniref:Sigma-54-dependent Fis family transcriptional regulator n=1 Tax=Schlesneria paludicola TaxID=360056 RepID=A0A7C2K136_9PLAN